ncbi:MAG: hypothetical protein Q7K29_02615 [Thermoleophilia bacterium]|nr:hypothetical protein [Thermoleophilia bacterium]
MKVVLAVVAMLGLILVWGGCGDDKQSSTGSQLDDEAAGASTSTVGGTGSTGGSVTGDSGQDVMVDYSMDQCTSDMTTRYGDVETARKVCSALQEDYSSSPSNQLANVLPTVESDVGATPLPGSTIPTPGTGGQTGGGTNTPGGGTGGNTNGGTGGWDGGGIEIVVPPAP